jgi:hypothetical protein
MQGHRAADGKAFRVSFGIEQETAFGEGVSGYVIFQQGL